MTYSFTDRLTSERELYRNGAQGCFARDGSNFGRRNEVFCHEVDEILAWLCFSSE